MFNYNTLFSFRAIIKKLTKGFNVGIIVNKDDNKNSDLTRRIDADLRTKLQSTSTSISQPDLTAQSTYLQDFKKTSRFGWVWIVLIVLAIISLLSIVFF